MVDSSTLVVGQNEGWFELVKIDENQIQIIKSANFVNVGHVFVMQMTMEP